MSEHGPADFTKCPECHRSGSVTFRIHVDGDGWFECKACDAYAAAPKLNTQPRVFK